MPTQSASNSTLLRSARQFQQALELLRTHADGADLGENDEVNEIRKGLRAIKTELERRGLEALLAEEGRPNGTPS